MQKTKEKIQIEGFAVIDGIYNDQEIEQIVEVIDSLDSSSPTFRKSKDLFAVRQILKEAPAIQNIIFSTNVKAVLEELFGCDYFVTKSIYFDKPASSNWFVPYHQDLTISVDAKSELQGFENWTVKQGQYAVQPPLSVLENNFTLRIHLDDTNENNGALKVIPKSHARGIYRADSINWEQEKETTCNVRKGGIMVMKPLLLHASNRTTNEKRRRVIHIEFSKSNLPYPINWAEKIDY